MKRSQLKRKGSLKKRNKSKATLDKADRALQDWYRRNYPTDLCEVCGSLAQLRHHHIEKSKSNYLRYNPINLIALCNKCHQKLHFGDNSIVATYSIKRGEEWLNEIEKLKNIHKPYYSKKELEEIIELYQ